MPKQQHKKVKLYTCMPDQTLQISMSAIEPEWPGFLSDKVGSGRKYLTRGGELFNDVPIATCHTWAEVMAFRPQVDTKPGGHVAAIVTNDAAFPVGRPLTPTESRAAMDQATVVGMQRALTDVSDQDHKEHLKSVASLAVMFAAAIAIIVICAIAASSYFGGDDATPAAGSVAASVEAFQPDPRAVQTAIAAGTPEAEDAGESEDDAKTP